MSVADHFDHTPDAAYVRDYDSGSARRQFNVSVTIFALLCAACAIAALVRFEAPASVAQPTVTTPPAYVGHL